MEDMHLYHHIKRLARSTDGFGWTGVGGDLIKDDLRDP